MDNGNGSFIPITEKAAFDLGPNAEHVFREKEILEIRGSYFLVNAIRRKRIILKLLSRDQVRRLGIPLPEQMQKGESR